MAELFEKDQVVEGVAFFFGDIDGKQLNSGTIFIKSELDQSKGNAKGFRTVEYKADNSEVIKRVLHNEFPVRCKVTYEMRVTKSSNQMIVVDIKPIGSAKIGDNLDKKAA
jgi:hypothetical protein